MSKKQAGKPAQEAREDAPSPVAPRLRLEYIEAGSLTENPLNWRRHPEEQIKSLKGLVGDPEVGWAGALLYNEMTGRLIDGHARRSSVSPDTPVPVLIGSWSEDAERKILATLDPVASMAKGDAEAYAQLVAQVTTDSLEVRDLMDIVQAALRMQPDEEEAAAAPEGESVLPEMELRPFEHYDYVLVLARSTPDWEALCEALGLERVNASPIPGKTKIGLARAVEASKVLALIAKAKDAPPAGPR